MQGKSLLLPLLTTVLASCGGDGQSSVNRDGGGAEPAPVGADVGTTGTDATATAVGDSAANRGAHP